MQQQNTNIIVYRDKLFLKSESFIPRAYLAFKNLTPIYTGYQKGEGPNGAAIIDIASNGAGTTLGEALFKQAGIVPANPLSRSFRDLLGRANQRVAAAADQAHLAVAGRLVELGAPTETLRV